MGNWKCEESEVIPGQEDEMRCGVSKTLFGPFPFDYFPWCCVSSKCKGREEGRQDGPSPFPHFLYLYIFTFQSS